ncbi:MAG: M20 family metallopeptidase [Intestinibacter sp.]|uniref:M20 metallopeptidase family protein n=1 Tax=Intestinibacter sp. TaxID=1965304 RepID=UPI0025B944E1|nr:M20 family metallopeptidase [Intestinibacter sp.]MCI6737731.1 M20 family metallopeptidase [Intestinibacter sp.]
MNKYLERAIELKPNTIKDRRHIHENPECGMHLPNTKEYVIGRLKEMNLEPKIVGDSGIVVLIEGKKPGKTVLLRCDMDALPMEEINELPFKSKIKAAHTCGHDIHTATMITVAQILSENIDDLEGNVKIVFQPGEEAGEGARMLIEEGVLENPKVDLAIAMHVFTTHESGTIAYAIGGATSSVNAFEIKIKGQGCHGSMPEKGIDPINTGMYIYQALQSLISRNISATERAVLTIGQFISGDAPNILPEEAIMTGSLRTYNPDVCDTVLDKIKQILKGAEAMFGATVSYREFFTPFPCSYNDPTETRKLVKYMEDIEGLNLVETQGMSGSEDFGFITQLVPSVYLELGAKVDGNDYVNHSPNVLFNEDCIPYGVAAFVNCAVKWLKDNK